MRGYSLSDLLIGKYYASSTDRTRVGIIKEAVRREDCLDADYVYSVRVRRENILDGDFWATVIIAIED